MFSISNPNGNDKEWISLYSIFQVLSKRVFYVKRDEKWYMAPHHTAAQFVANGEIPECAKAIKSPPKTAIKLTPTVFMSAKDMVTKWEKDKNADLYRKINEGCRNYTPRAEPQRWPFSSPTEHYHF